MSIEISYISIGFDKNGEAEFGVTATIMDLSLKQMQALRSMIPVAIYVAEDMWHREQESHQQAAEQKSFPNGKPNRNDWEIKP